eukprot:GHVT01090042.1.p1 GENE.GHVT01090042.1~~GHVT01090042.1.p1  ORF type:complete len:386 (+),score=88.89 GHVT01090042.1:164-1321(+)
MASSVFASSSPRSSASFSPASSSLFAAFSATRLPPWCALLGCVLFLLYPSAPPSPPSRLPTSPGGCRPGPLLVGASSFAAQQLERLYCGNANCYQLLGSVRSSSEAELRKAYRRVALQYHPDKNASPDAATKMIAINKAYEVLIDKEVRKAYDYYLDHPTDMMALIYGIRAVYPARTNPLFVLLLLVLFLSVGQLIHSYNNYFYFRNCIRNTDRFQRTLREKIFEEHGPNFKKLPQKKQAAIRSGLEDRLLTGGVVIDDRIIGKFMWKDLYALRVFFLLFRLVKACMSYARWYWRFVVLRQEYGVEEKTWLTRRRLGIGEGEWQALPEATRQVHLARRLWVDELWKVYAAEKAEEERLQRIQCSRYRQMRRARKRGGVPFNYNED